MIAKDEDNRLEQMPIVILLSFFCLICCQHSTRFCSVSQSAFSKVEVIMLTDAYVLGIS